MKRLRQLDDLSLKAGGAHARRHILRALRDLVSPAAHLDEAITRLRAVQAAAFRLGWLIHIEHDINPANPTDWTPTIGPHDERRWRRLASPLHAATITLAALSQAPSTELAEATLADLKPDSITVGDSHI